MMSPRNEPIHCKRQKIWLKTEGVQLQYVFTGICFVLFQCWGLNRKALFKPGKYSTTELYSQSAATENFFLMYGIVGDQSKRIITLKPAWATRQKERRRQTGNHVAGKISIWTVWSGCQVHHIKWEKKSYGMTVFVTQNCVLKLERKLQTIFK